jgi:hypothetical protein
VVLVIEQKLDFGDLLSFSIKVISSISSGETVLGRTLEFLSNQENTYASLFLEPNLDSVSF